MEIKYEIRPEDLNQLRVANGWKGLSDEQAKRAVDGSMISIGIYEGDKALAIGRLVGDGALKAFLTDILVLPEEQRKGYGAIVVKELIKACQEKMKKGDILCIAGSPTAGNRDFYIKCGMIYNPEHEDGVYLWLNKD